MAYARALVRIAAPYCCPSPRENGEREIGPLFHTDVRAGMVPVDWGDLVDDEDGAFGERERMW